MGDSPVWTPRRALYWAPTSTQLQSTSRPASKGPSSTHYCLCSKRLWKGHILSSRPSQPQSTPLSPTCPGTWWEIYTYVPPGPGLQTSNMAIESQTTFGPHSSPSQPWSRATPAHLGAHPVTRHQSSQGSSESHAPCTPSNWPAV